MVLLLFLDISLRFSASSSAWLFDFLSARPPRCHNVFTFGHLQLPLLTFLLFLLFPYLAPPFAFALLRSCRSISLPNASLFGCVSLCFHCCWSSLPSCPIGFSGVDLLSSCPFDSHSFCLGLSCFVILSASGFAVCGSRRMPLLFF